MKPLFLSALMVMASFLPSFSQAEMSDAFYIIKDGKLQPGVTVANTYCPLEMTEYDGYLSFKKKGLYYQNIRFNLPADHPLFLDNKNLVVEYMLPETAICDTSHKENIYNNVCAYKEAATMSVQALDTTGRWCSRIYIDGKFDANSAKDFVSYNRFAFARNKSRIASVVLSYIDRWQWFEEDNEPMPDSLKIKNLYYAKPKTNTSVFFSSQFDGTNTWDEYQSLFYSYSGVEVVSNNEDDYIPRLKMMYMNQRYNWTGSDGSGYLPSELFHGLLVKNRALYKSDHVLDTDTLFIRPIALPKNAKSIDVEALVRVDRREREGARTEPLTAYIKFNNSKQLVKLFNDTIPNIYTLERTTVAVPAGAKSCSLIFLQAPTATYVVDNLIMSYKNTIVATKPKTGPVAGKPVVLPQKK